MVDDAHILVLRVMLLIVGDVSAGVTIPCKVMVGDDHLPYHLLFTITFLHLAREGNFR